MVDFKDERTVTTPSWEILKLLALEKRENLMLAIEFYFKHKYDDQVLEQDINIVRGRLWCLYYELEAWLKRSYDDVLLASFRVKIDSKDIVEVFEVVTFINKFMDDKKLTRIDTRNVYDKTRVEVENEQSEL